MAAQLELTSERERLAQMQAEAESLQNDLAEKAWTLSEDRMNFNTLLAESQQSFEAGKTEMQQKTNQIKKSLAEEEEEEKLR